MFKSYISRKQCILFLSFFKKKIYREKDTGANEEQLWEQLQEALTEEWGKEAIFSLYPEPVLAHVELLTEEEIDNEDIYKKQLLGHPGQLKTIKVWTGTKLTISTLMSLMEKNQQYVERLTWTLKEGSNFNELSETILEKCVRLREFICINEIQTEPHALCKIFQALRGCVNLSDISVMGTTGISSHYSCFNANSYCFLVQRLMLQPSYSEEATDLSFMRYFPQLREVTFKDYFIDLTAAFLGMSLANSWVEIIHWECAVPLPGVYLASVNHLNLSYDIPIPQFFVANRQLKHSTSKFAKTLEQPSTALTTSCAITN